MIDGSEKRNRQLAFELQNSHVCEKRSKSFKKNHCLVSISVKLTAKCSLIKLTKMRYFLAVVTRWRFDKK